MTRGTTPTLVYAIPYTAEQIESGYITYVQGTKAVLEKELPGDGVTMEDGKITINLSQEETLKLSSVSTLRHQIRLKLSDGTVVASNIISSDVKAILKDGEL